MKNRILCFAIFAGLLMSSFRSAAQITLTYNDTTVCPGDTITMCAATSGTVDPLSVDDGYTGTINIGFPFTFFGQTYTQCIVSGNGYISFDVSRGGGFSPWQWQQMEGFNSADAKNDIFATFCDLFLPAGGAIRYEHFGTPGHRKFVVEWCHIPVFGCNNLWITSELVLYEGSNVIEVHTKHISPIVGSCPSASSPNYGQVIQGLTNQDGTASFYPTNRGTNNSPNNWGIAGVDTDGMRFTPDSSGTTWSYTMDSIPYQAWIIIDASQANNLKWYTQSQPNLPFHTGSCATVAIDGSQNYYTVRFDGIPSSCSNNDSVHLEDTVHIEYGTQYDTAHVNICTGGSYDFFGHILTESGTYDTVMLPPGGIGCKQFARVYLHVNPYPDVTLTDSMPNQYFCKGSEGEIALAHPSVTYSYQWTRGGQDLNGETNSLISTGTTGDYQIVVTTDSGCVDSSILVHFMQDTVNMDFLATPAYGCNEDTIKITNNSEPGTAYKWYFGDGTYPPDSIRNPIHIYDNQGTYQIKLIMTDTFGCTDSLLKIIQINHPFDANFTVSADSLCQGSATTVQFNNQSVGATSYQWNFGDGSATSNQASPSHTYTLAGSHTAMLIARNNLPCYDTAYHIIYIDSVPFLHVTANKENLCIGDKLTLNLNYLQQTAKAVNWNFGDGTLWTNNGQMGTITHSFVHPGTYNIAVSVDYAVCPPTHDSIQINVHDLPKVYLGPDTTLCLQGAPIMLTNLTPNGNPLTHYKWNTGDTTSFLKVVHPGLYSLTATLFNCSTTESVKINKDCYVDIPNAFTPNGDGQNDYFYPRKYLSNGVVGFTMTIYNRWGEKVFETKNANGRGWDGTLNDKPQPEGVYIYEINAVYSNGKAEHYTGNVTLIR